MQKLLLPIFMALNLVAVVVGVGLTFMGTLGHQTAAVREVDLQPQLQERTQIISAQPIVYTMEPFTVNLDGLPQRVINLEVNLHVLDEDGYEEVVLLGAQARDTIVRLLNSKKFSDLETIQGKLTIKDEIANRLNNLLKVGVIQDVFFTKFNVAVQ